MWTKTTCKKRLTKLVTAIQSDTAMHVLFRSLLGHTSLKDASWETAHGWYPWSDTHGVPASSWELPQLPHTTCAQQPANPICLPDKQFHILSRKDFRTTAKTHSLHCFCLVLSPQGHTGWLEMGTYHRANTSTRDFLMDMQPVQDTQAKAGQEATQGANAVVPHDRVKLVPPAHPPCVLIPPHQMLKPALAVLNVAPSAFWGESLIFQGKLDTQGLTLITGSGHWSMKTGAETTSLLLLQEFCNGKPESVRVPPRIQDLLCLNNKREAAQNNKHSHVSAAQYFTLRETLLALSPTNSSPGLLQSLHLLHIFILSNK